MISESELERQGGAIVKAFVSGLMGCSLLLAAIGARAQDSTAMGPLSVSTAQYDRGDAAFVPCTQAQGCALPSGRTAEVRAEVYYPDDLTGGPFPLVLFLHGRHSPCYEPSTGSSTSVNDDLWPCTDAGSGYVPIPSHRGYDYVGRVLASYGYLVASVSADGINAQDVSRQGQGIVDRAYLLDRHFGIWSQFNTIGSTVDAEPFASKLIGNVDLQRSGTMGHSRGGDGVVKHFALFNGGPGYKVRAVLAIAPTNFSAQVINNVNLGVLLSYCDGDVYTLEGLLFYDRARYFAGDQTTKFTFLSLGANHNFFNSVWTPDCWTPMTCWNDGRGAMPFATVDDSDFKFSGDAFCASGAASRLSGAEQRGVGLAYVAAFFRYTIGGEAQLLPLLRGDVAPPATVDPNVFVGFHPPQSARLDLNRLNDDTELSQTTLTGSGGLRGAVNGADLATYERCGYDQTNACFPASSEAREAHLSAFFPASGLSRLRTQWNATTDTFVNELPAGARDVSAFGTLQFRVGVDYTDTTNPSPVEFSVRLEDGVTSRTASASSQLGQNDLYFPPGDYSATTVMNTLRLPLTLFAGVNLTDLRRVTLQYAGSATGTVLISDIAFTDTPETPSATFPTVDPNDGKLMTVTGQGVASIDIPSVSFRIAVPPGQTSFNVAIFDGDQSSHFDYTAGAPTNTCFRLVSDPLGDGPTPGEQVIAIKGDAFFADGAYTMLYGGPVHESARNLATNAHIYRLDVVTGPGTPTDTECPAADATKTIIQGFKVKSSGQVSIEYGEFSFIGADATGAFASPDTYMASGRNTTYDGRWDFFIAVPTTGTPATLTFSDSDADDLEDEVPGVAAGANAAIEYVLFDGNGTTVLTNTNVSGNYDFLTTDRDRDDNTVNTNGIGGMWRWHWANVLTENNIHVWPPVASPPRMAVYAQPVQRLKVTGAQPFDYWLGHPAQIDDLLPIRLGTKHSKLKIRDVDDALCILDEMNGDHLSRRHGGHGKCGCSDICDGHDHGLDGLRSLALLDRHHRFDRRHGKDRCHHGCHPHHGDSLELLRHLAAELLLVDLNVALDASKGQDLTVAFVYGRIERVGDVITMANDIVGVSLRHCSIPKELLDDAELVLTLLDTINAGEVTFVDPMLKPPPNATPTLLRAPVTGSPGATVQSGKGS